MQGGSRRMRDAVRLSDDHHKHNDKDPSLAMDRAGQLWAAWQSYHAGADRIVARSVLGGIPGPLIQVSETPGINMGPALAKDATAGSESESARRAS